MRNASMSAQTPTRHGYECPVCHKGFATLAGRNKHVAYHDPDSPAYSPKYEKVADPSVLPERVGHRSKAEMERRGRFAAPPPRDDQPPEPDRPHPQTPDAPMDDDPYLCPKCGQKFDSERG